MEAIKRMNSKVDGGNDKKVFNSLSDGFEIQPNEMPLVEDLRQQKRPSPSKSVVNQSEYVNPWKAEIDNSGLNQEKQN
jgi:hypothetical protein